MAEAIKITSGVLCLIILGYLGIHAGGAAQRAESKIFRKTEIAISDDAHGWARISVDGQKVSVTGVARSEAAREATRAAIANAIGLGGPVFGGVVAVDDSAVVVIEDAPIEVASPTLAPVAPQKETIAPDAFKWRATYDGFRVSLSGYAPSAEAKSLIVAAAAKNFTIVSDEMKLADGVDERAWIEAATTALRALAQLETGEVSGRALAYSVSGVANNEETRSGKILAGARHPGNVQLLLPPYLWLW
ncbi:MAG: hypothetical protein AAGJ87_10055 [Pseudomonadota bacterium]